MVKHLPRYALLFLAVLLLLIAGVMVLVSYRPHDMGFLLPRIEAALNTEENPIHLNVRSAHIDWRQFRNLGRVTLSDVRLRMRSGQLVAVLPEIQVRLSPLPLLMGQASIDWVIVPDSVLVLTRAEDGELYFGFGEKEARVPVSSFFATGSEDEASDMDLPFSHALVENARILIRNEEGKILLRAEKSDIALSEVWGGMEAAVRLNFSYRDQTGAFQGIARSTNDGETITVATRFANTPIGLVCGMLPDCGPFQGVRGAVSGKVSGGWQEGRMDHADAAVVAERVRIRKGEWFAEDLEFNRISARAALKDKGQKLEVDTFDLQNPELRILGKAEATRDEEKGWGLSLGAAIKNRFNVAKLYRYWPVPLARDTRTWVVENITKGYSTGANVEIRLTPEEMQMDVLPDHFLKAGIPVEKAELRYLPGLPLMTNINGNVSFTGETMRAVLVSGRVMQGIQVKKADLLCPDLNKPATPMVTALALEGPAGEAAHILQHKAFAFDDALGLDPKRLQGSVEAEMQLEFDAFSGDAPAASEHFDLSGVGYEVNVALKNVGQDKLFEKYTISALSGALSANEKGFAFEGKGQLNGSPLTVAAEQQSGKDVHLDVKGRMAREALVAFGMPNRSEISDGMVGIDARLTARKEEVLLERVKLDLKDAAIGLSDISWQKARGIDATLSVKADKPDIPNYSFLAKGGGLYAKGRLSLDKEQALQSASMERISTPTSNFALEYTKEGDGFRVKLHGDALDNSASYAKSENSILGDFPAIRLDVNLRKLLLRADHPLLDVKGNLNCTKQRCESAYLTARTGEKGLITGSISHEAGKRLLNIDASDAGELLRAIDMTDRVFGGVMRLSGSYDESTVPPTFAGPLFIEKFNVKQSEIFARIFSIASLSGLSNALTGSGIDFDKLRADVTHKAGVIKLKNGRASGNAVGYTAEGSINTKKSTVNLKGVLVPAYVLNSFFGKIPIIGEIVGGEGEGIISFRYSVKGPYSDPDVSVNPFSGLTPGFLRNIFGIFDSGDEEEEDAPANAAPASAPAPAPVKQP